MRVKITGYVVSESKKGTKIKTKKKKKTGEVYADRSI